MANRILDTQRAAGGNAILETQESGSSSGITAVAAWTEGSEVFAMTGTVNAPPAGITAAAAWTEGSEVFAMAGIVSGPPDTSGAPNRYGASVMRATAINGSTFMRDVLNQTVELL